MKMLNLMGSSFTIGAALIVFACSSNVDVRAALDAGGADAVARNGTTSAAGGAGSYGGASSSGGSLAGASGSTVFTCGSTFDWSEFKNGDPCNAEGATAVDANGSVTHCCGFGRGGTSQVDGTCNNVRLQMTTSEPIELSEPDAGGVPDTNASWSTCPEALANGRSGEACTWNYGMCSRATSDPCCIEVAYCAGTTSRMRLCAPGCTNVSPDASQETVMSCDASIIANYDACKHYAVPCRAGLRCDTALRLPISDSSVITQGGLMDGISWCAHGVLFNFRTLIIP